MGQRRTVQPKSHPVRVVIDGVGRRLQRLKRRGAEAIAFRTRQHSNDAGCGNGAVDTAAAARRSGMVTKRYAERKAIASYQGATQPPAAVARNVSGPTAEQHRRVE